jgi:uncharacterized membrane-anchored protein YitT (DUF2179 family)
MRNEEWLKPPIESYICWGQICSCALEEMRDTLTAADSNSYFVERQNSLAIIIYTVEHMIGVEIIKRYHRQALTEIYRFTNVCLSSHIFALKIER